MRVSQEFESRQYYSEEDTAEDSLGFRVETDLFLDSDSRRVDHVEEDLDKGESKIWDVTSAFEEDG